MRRISLALPILLLVLSCVEAAQAYGNHPAKPTGSNVNLVAYSTPKIVMGHIIPRFLNTAAGQGVSFSQSYGPSGTQAQAIVAGQPADIAFLSTGLDIDTIADAGLISKSWEKAPFDGIAADSVVSFAVRPGNPKHIHTWSDLVKPGVQVLTPDPFSSGSAKWNVLAAYGAMRKTGMSDKKAMAFVLKLFHHVVQQDSSGSNAMATFLAGKGDVLLTYESEAYTAVAAGKKLGLVIPKQTMLIELPMVPLKSASSAAKAFVKYCHSPVAQTLFAKNGYRPVLKKVLNTSSMTKWRKRYYGGSRLVFKIDDKLFGGWRKANKVWFAQNTGRMVKIEREVGGPTG